MINMFIENHPLQPMHIATVRVALRRYIDKCSRFIAAGIESNQESSVIQHRNMRARCFEALQALDGEPYAPFPEPFDYTLDGLRMVREPIIHINNQRLASFHSMAIRMAICDGIDDQSDLEALNYKTVWGGLFYLMTAGAQRG